MNLVEVAANALNAASLVLAGRHSLHTWWVGAIGCLLLALLLVEARLYADAMLQVFFVATSVLGWWRWSSGDAIPVRRCASSTIVALGIAGVCGAAAYGWLLFRFTNAYAPFLDSAVLAFGVLGQFLLMERRVESWWCWLLVNTIAAPLYAARDLHLTAAFCTATWINALVSLVHWRRLLVRA